MSRGRIKCESARISALGLGILFDRACSAAPIQLYKYPGPLKRPLHFSQHAIAADDERRRPPIHSHLDIGNPKITLPRRSGCRWFTPGRDVDVFRNRLFRFRLALYAMVGEGCVTAVFCVTLWHMATDTVAVGRRMRLEKLLCGRPGILIDRTPLAEPGLDADHGKYRTTIARCYYANTCSGPSCSTWLITLNFDAVPGGRSLSVDGVRIFERCSRAKIAGLASPG